MPAALIAGAGGDLGQVLGRRLQADGFELVLPGRDAGRFQAARGARRLQADADCATPEGARAIIENSLPGERRPDVLAHRVGNIRLGAPHSMRDADFVECLQANLISALHTLVAFVAHLRADNRPGAAVLVSSAAARIGTPNHEAVAPAKARAEGLARAAAATCAASGIRVNVVAPGTMETPTAAGIPSDVVAHAAAARQDPLPGIGSADELAGQMAWLLPPAAARATGQVRALDGGLSAIRPLVK